MKICGCHRCHDRELRESALREAANTDEFVRIMHASFAADEEANLRLLIRKSGVTIHDVEEQHGVRWDAPYDQAYEEPPVWPYDLEAGV